MSVAIRRAMVIWLIAGGIVIVPVTAAQATDTGLRRTVRRDLARIHTSQVRIRAASVRLRKTHSPVALIHAIEAQDRNLTALRHRVRRQKASTATGRRGKADIVRGLTMIVDSNVILARDLARAARHEHVPKRQVAAATLTDRRGNRDLLVGAKLLRV